MTRLVWLPALVWIGCGTPDDGRECHVGGEVQVVPFTGPTVEATSFECDPPEGNWFCYLGPSHSGLIYYRAGSVCGFEHVIGFTFVPDAPHFASIQMTLDANGAVLTAAVATSGTSDDTDRIPVSSGILSIEGDRIDPEGDGCVRGRLAFVRDGVLVQGEFLTNPCWNF